MRRGKHYAFVLHCAALQRTDMEIEEILRLGTSTSPPACSLAAGRSLTNGSSETAWFGGKSRGNRHGGFLHGAVRCARIAKPVPGRLVKTGDTSILCGKFGDRETRFAMPYLFSAV